MGDKLLSYSEPRHLPACRYFVLVEGVQDVRDHSEYKYWVRRIYWVNSQNHYLYLTCDRRVAWHSDMAPSQVRSDNPLHRDSRPVYTGLCPFQLWWLHGIFLNNDYDKFICKRLLRTWPKHHCSHYPLYHLTILLVSHFIQLRMEYQNDKRKNNGYINLLPIDECIEHVLDVYRSDPQQAQPAHLRKLKLTR